MSFEIISTSVRIEEPVVVNPETDSKYASTNDGISPERIYGNAPKREIEIQLRHTIKKLSLIFASLTDFFRFANNISNPPEAAVIIKEAVIGKKLSVRYIRVINRFSSIKILSNKSTIPRVLKISLKLKIFIKKLISQLGSKIKQSWQCNDRIGQFQLNISLGHI
jgi:hypothetical protein